MMLVFFATSIVFLASVILGKTAKVLPPHELRRRARSKDGGAVSLYKAAVYGKLLELLIWLIGSLSLGAAVLMASSVSWWAALVLFLLGSWVVLAWLPARSSNSWSWKIAAWVAPVAAWILSQLHPLSNRVTDKLSAQAAAHAHTGAYEIEDLLKIIDAQNRQPDNRIPEQDLKLASGALTFGNKTVGRVMTPRRKLKLVSEQDSIGPLLMDELHASGFSRFPVVSGSAKSASLQIVGTLYLKDLVGHSGKGKVGELMIRQCYFINESQTLRQALAAFLKTDSHLLVVVNNFEEIVGVISIDDVLGQIIGEPVLDEFDKYDDLRAVAGQKATLAHKEVKNPEQT